MNESFKIKRKKKVRFKDDRGRPQRVVGPEIDIPSDEPIPGKPMQYSALEDKPYDKRKQSHIQMTLESPQGKLLYQRFLMAVANRASVTSASSLLGVRFFSVSKALREGRRDYKRGIDSFNARFFNDVYVAVGNAVMQAEMEVGIEDPKWFLTKGFGRVLLGDVYNVETKDGKLNYNLDGSISAPEVDDMSLRIGDSDIDSESNERANEHQRILQDHHTIEALKALREAGVDLNELIDLNARGETLNLGHQELDIPEDPDEV